MIRRSGKLNKYLPWVITGLVVISIYLIGTNIPEETIRQIIKDAGPWGPLIFIFLTFTTYIFAPLSGTPLLFAGFYAFGQTAVIYGSIAAFISAITNFYIAKKWGRFLVERLTGEENLQKVDKLTQNYGLVALFFFRLILNSFHDVISYAFGLTSMKFTPYILISALGMILNMVFWYFISSKITNPFTYTLLHILAAYILVIAYLTWIIIKRRLKK